MDDGGVESFVFIPTFYQFKYMPITTNGSYIPCCDEFLAHWLQCNNALVSGGVVAKAPGRDAVTQAQFDSMRSALLEQQSLVQSKMNDQEIARGEIELLKVAMLGRFGQFVELMDAFYQDTKFYVARPMSPRISEGQSNFVTPMLDAASLWLKMNNGTPPDGVSLPLVLGDGTTQSVFSDSITVLQQAYRAEKAAEQDVDLEREARNRMQVAIYDTLKAYRLAVPPKMVMHPDLVATLPKLTPDDGHTPVPVTAEGNFVAPSSSHVTHSASSEALLSHYELEGCIGEEFLAEDAVFLGRHEPDEPNEFTVQFGLSQPGLKVSYKVYVVLTTGNRAGSDTVVVQRPV